MGWEMPLSGGITDVANAAERLALSPYPDMLVLQKDTNTLYRWDAGTSTWIPLSGSGGVSGSGSPDELAVWDSASSIHGSSNFRVDDTEGVISMGPTAVDDVEESVLKTATIALGAYVGLNLFAFPDTYKCMVVEYSIERGSNLQLGTLEIVQDGSSVHVTDTYSQIGDPKILLSSSDVTHTVAAGVVQIKYTSTDSMGNLGTFKYSFKRWI